MGGMNSTRWGEKPTKPFAEKSLRIDIRQLKRDGCLKVKGEQVLTWQSGSGQAQSSISMYVHDDGILCCYTHKGCDVRVFASFNHTACNLGGARIWFNCPGCENRRAVLYVGDKLACRKCHNMAYACQSEGVSDRQIRRAIKVTKRAGARTMLCPIPPRPKYMHHRTYSRLQLEYEQARFAALANLKF